MQGDADIAAAAALLAEPARAALVTAVIADGALPVTDLADRAQIAPSTASEHLRRLVAGGFLSSEKRGRGGDVRVALHGLSVSPGRFAQDRSVRF